MSLDSRPKATILPQLLGYPRIGPRRELKWTLENAWAGKTGPVELEGRVQQLRAAHLDEQRGLVGSSADDFFLYDQVLETSMMFGLVPEHLRDRAVSTEPGEAFAALTELARGSREREAWEMTKWFDTNYHYVVPEIDGAPAGFRPLPWRVPTGDDDVAWAILGPYSLVKLAKVEADLDEPWLAAALGRELWAWAHAGRGTRIQIDEPCLGLVMDKVDRALLEAAYSGAGDLTSGHGGAASSHAGHTGAAHSSSGHPGSTHAGSAHGATHSSSSYAGGTHPGSGHAGHGSGFRTTPLITVQFGRPSEETVGFLGKLGFAVQVPLGMAPGLSKTAAWAAQPEHVVSVMDGRSVWQDDFEPVAEAFGKIDSGEKPLRIVPSTSLMFLPYTTEGEDLPRSVRFAREKARELRTWAEALKTSAHPTAPPVRRVTWPAPGELVTRPSRPERRTAQKDLDLPAFPTTTTGSLPQTAEVRSLRALLNKGEIDRAEYERRVDELIRESIGWQEERGLDVLVHGEFERTDMVEYFAAKMDGFHVTKNGWVNSYGSRCVRPPILERPPSISEPMTVREWKVAQAASEKPVKGMLTGPVTIVNWSFRPRGVPDDRLFWAVAQPIAEEVRHLVQAGARIIQIDEPAVRERWPLPTEDAEELRRVYARGVRAALNHVFAAPAEVQMHTHMCYGDFGEIVPLWADAGVDVASIEYSRSKDESYIRQFYELFADGHLQIGPGIFDVHSPHSPGRETMNERLDYFLEFMEPGDLWVNPDCGLKTRRWEEIEVQLADMVAAAREMRKLGERMMTARDPR